MSDDDSTSDASSSAMPQIGLKRSRGAPKKRRHPRQGGGAVVAPLQPQEVKTYPSHNEVVPLLAAAKVQSEIACNVESTVDSSALFTSFMFAKNDRWHRWIPLHAATKWKRIRAAEIILRLRPGLLRHAASCGDTPMHYAVSDFALTRMIIDTSQTDVTIRDHLIQALCHQDRANGNTPVHMAALGENIDVIRLLFETCPAAFDVANEDRGFTPLYYAIASGNPPMLDLWLTMHPAGFNVSDLLGNTPFHHAVMRCRDETKAEVIKLLLRRRRDGFNVPNKEGCFPADFALPFEIEVRWLMKEAGLVSRWF